MLAPLHYKNFDSFEIVVIPNILLRRFLRLLPPRSVDHVTCCLKLVRVWPEYEFSNLANFLRALCGQMSHSVSQSVGQSVDHGWKYKVLFKNLNPNVIIMLRMLATSFKKHQLPSTMLNPSAKPLGEIPIAYQFRVINNCIYAFYLHGIINKETLLNVWDC